MSIPMLVTLLLIQPQSSQAARAADAFALDLPQEDATASPAQPPATASSDASMPEPAVSTGSPGTRLSLDTPIADLIADPRSKAILDRDMPGMSDDPNLPKFRALSLRKLAPLSGGQMTAALLAKVATDLAAIDGVAPAAVKVQSRRSLPSGR